MKIGAILNQLQEVPKNIGIENKNKDKFGNVLTDFIGQVNQSQLNADKVTNDFVSGKGGQVQDVMIASEEARTNLDLLMEIRNKTIDMYKELTRMQA